MYWQVMTDGAGYHAGEVLDLGDTEAAAQVARLVTLRPVDAPASPRSPAPKPAVTPVTVIVSKPPVRLKYLRG
jgi:hypothetical protein